MIEARSRSKTREALGGPPGLPVVGNLFQIRLDKLHSTLERWADQYGPLYRIRIGPVRMVVVSDPDTINRMHRERPRGFRRTRALEAVTAEMRLMGVFSAEGEDWLRQRKIVVMALNTAHLKSFFPKLAITVGRLMRRWECAADAQEPVDLCRDLMRLTVDVTTQLAFGVDFNTLETSGPVIQRNLDKVFPMLHRRINAPIPYWRYIRLPKDRELDRALDRIRKQVDEIIREVRERMRAEPALYASPTNFLEAIIAAQEVKGVGFSDDDIFANVCTLLLAGEDTTAHTIAWTVSYFLRYPEHFARARAEVDAGIAPAASVEAIEQAARFPFLDAFFNEAMRLKPVAPVNTMEPVEDTEILGHLIPRKTVIMTLNRHIATRDEHFGDAARFDPGRWLKSDAERGRPHDTSTFLPFGAGPRFCPGRNLALLQIRTVLAMLCRNFDVEPASPGRPVEERLAFTMMPTNLVVRMKRRDT
ncbi:MAG: cytochrome P450 [Chromatiales bacterium]|nr:cytochrome P450 [Chromatiales bacterium]